MHEKALDDYIHDYDDFVDASGAVNPLVLPEACVTDMLRGRATCSASTPMLDLLITLLSMGQTELKRLWATRKQLFQWWTEEAWETAAAEQQQQQQPLPPQQQQRQQQQQQHHHQQQRQSQQDSALRLSSLLAEFQAEIEEEQGLPPGSLG